MYYVGGIISNCNITDWRNMKLVATILALTATITKDGRRYVSSKPHILKISLVIVLLNHQIPHLKFRLVDMFMSCTEEYVKEEIIKIFTKESKLRIVIATVAFGKGIDCYNVQQMSFPTDVESYRTCWMSWK